MERIIGLLYRMADMEKRTAIMYNICAEHFPDKKQLLNNIADDERMHEQAIMNMIQIYNEHRDMFSVKLLLPLDAVDIVIRSIDRIIERIEHGHESIDDISEGILAIEQSLAEIYTGDILESENDAFVEIRERIHRETIEHVDRVKHMLNKEA